MLHCRSSTSRGRFDHLPSLLVATVLLFFPSQVFPEEASTPTTYLWEFNLSELLMQSQEYTDNLFPDYDSRTKPFPAIGKLLGVERKVGTAWHLGANLSLPLREELIITDMQQRTTFNFSKSLILAFDRMILNLPIGVTGSAELRQAFGFLTPLSHRFGTYLIPLATLRLRIGFPGGSGLHLGLGYAGVVVRGTFFLTLGIGYRI